MIHVNFQEISRKLSSKLKAVGKAVQCLRMALTTLIFLNSPNPPQIHINFVICFCFVLSYLAIAAKREILFLRACINIHLCSSAFSIQTFHCCHLKMVTNATLFSMADVNSGSILLLTFGEMTIAPSQQMEGEDFQKV